MSTKMGSLSSLSYFLFLIIACLSAMNVCVGKEFKVGDWDGWRVPAGNDFDFYSQWAGKNRFHVGDSLVFEYTNDSVLQVDKWGYYHCNTSHPISNFNNGKNIFYLDKPGPAYFISGTLVHCKNDQRLLIEVMGLHHMAQSPPSIARARSPDPTSYVAPAPSPHSASGVLYPVSFALMTLLVAFIYFV